MSQLVASRSCLNTYKLHGLVTDTFLCISCISSLNAKVAKPSYRNQSIDLFN